MSGRHTVSGAPSRQSVASEASSTSHDSRLFSPNASPILNREWSLLENVFLEPMERRDTLLGSPLSETASTKSISFRRSLPPLSRVTSYFSNADRTPMAFADPMQSEPEHINIDDADTQLPSTDEYYSDSDFDMYNEVPANSIKSRFNWLPNLSTLQRDILKCALAYFIGSLFTFNDYLSTWVSDIVPNHALPGPSPSGHMVATVTVYFNPAKSLGAMQEADIYCLAAAVFSAFVALASMDTFWFFEIREGWEWLADALTFIWIAVAMSIIAWVKLWMSKPSFSPAASMASIIIFVTVVKEGGLHILLQVTLLVLIGSTISNLICVSLWPRSAAKALQTDVVNSLNSFATLLEMLTRAFLLDEDFHHKRPDLQRAVKDHEATFTSLKRSRNEAKSEWWNSRVQSPSAAYDSSIDSLTRLAQHLGGLRSGVNLQLEYAINRRRNPTVNSFAFRENGEADELDALERAFGDLVEEIAPPLTALASTCVRTLKKLRYTFVQVSKHESPRQIASIDFDELSAEVGRALFTFERTSSYALGRIFERAETTSQIEEATGSHQSDAESLYLVYFFIFNLQEFSTELIALIEVLAIIHDASRTFTSRWSKIRRWVQARSVLRGLGVEPKRSLKGKISNLGPADGRRAGIRSKLFPPVKPHAPGTMHRLPRSSLSFINRQKQRIWSFQHGLKDPDLRYAIKTGTATALLALPAFIDATRDLFVKYRGEWALISFFVVMSKTIGATNKLSVHRVLGTLIGATTAATVSTLFPSQPYVLATFGFFFSLPCFWIIVGKPAYGTSGRFVLLTYNLTCLFRYNIREGASSVWDIAIHRSLAVIVGVLWALIVSRWWWPTQARRELTQGLSELCLNMSWFYTSLIRRWSEPQNVQEYRVLINPSSDPERQNLLGMLRPSKEPNPELRRFMEMELYLQLHLLELQGLVAQAEVEFRLKGPFPVAMYRDLLASLQTILDNFHSIRCVTMREEWHSLVHRDFIQSVQAERRAMVGNVTLYFSTLSNAFGLKAPLPPYLPPAQEARERLVEAIRGFVRAQRLQPQRSGPGQLMFIAYALMMRSVITELEFLGSSLQGAFGVVGGSTASFEELFV